MEKKNTKSAKVLSVNVGGARQFDYNGRAAQSAIWKFPVAGRVRVSGVRNARGALDNPRG